MRAKWHRRVKQAVSIPLDSNVLVWLTAKGDGLQSKVNGMLGERMLEEVSQ